MKAPDKIRTLLVEDEFIIAMSEIAALSRSGYEVIHAGTAEEAIAYVRERSGSIDLVLMDINLGEGADGIDISYEIRKISKVPIIFLSSCAVTEVLARTCSLTSWGYIMKGGMETLDHSIRTAFGCLSHTISL